MSNETLIPSIPTIQEVFNQNLSAEQQSVLLLWVSLLLFGLIVWVIFELGMNFYQKSRPRFCLTIKTLPNFASKEAIHHKILILITKLHRLAKNSVITFEIHKLNQEQFFLFSTSNPTLLKHIQAELSQISGLDFRGNSNLEHNLSWYFGQNTLHKLQLSARSKFENFKKAEYRVVGSVCSFLGSLQPSQNGSVIVTFRPNYKSYKIQSQIAKLNNRLRTNSKKYGTDLNLVEKTQELKNKKSSELFTVKITVLSDSQSITDNLAACFALLNGGNQFRERLSKAGAKSIKHVSNSPLIPQKVSFLNCKELASVINIVDFASAETSNSIIVEKNPEIQLIGKSESIIAQDAKENFNKFR